MSSYREKLESLREAYIKATPDQRLHVIRQRIDNPDHGPNTLIIYVAAIEGLSRSLVMHQMASSKDDLSRIYPKYKHKGIKELIDSYLRKKSATDGTSFFGDEIWEKLGYAIEFRHLLAHECTYLGQDTYPDLINTCEIVFNCLLEVEGLNSG